MKKANWFAQIKNQLLHALLSMALLYAAHTVTGQSIRISIAQAGNQVVISWPEMATNCILQSATSLTPTAWTKISIVPVIVNGQYVVTNTICGVEQFYQLSQTPIPAGMTVIPAGTFIMGDPLDNEDDADLTNITVSAFYMDTNLVTYALWQSVYIWATNMGYAFDNAGSGKAPNHPVQTVSWYDAVKWCNARSQQAGLTPVYYTDTNLTLIYKIGDVDSVSPNWAANGYRLPTEAEWEKAARGGLSGLRFPWGDTISENQANYFSNTNAYSYDLGPSGLNALFDSGASPFTSPAGYFAPNGYGLYDMGGNIFQLCWDWYGEPYGQPSAINPTGPATATGHRTARGGCWVSVPIQVRCAFRGNPPPSSAYNGAGFRCVRGFGN